MPSCSKLSNNLPNYGPNFILLLFYIFFIAFLFSNGYISKISTKLYILIFLFFTIFMGVLVWLCSCLIILSGDVEVNPGPKNSVSNLVISEYNLIRSDHPSNTNLGGVCLYYKNYLSLRVLNISYLKECLNFELKIGDKSCNFIALDRSPSQSQDDFETFSDKFEMKLETLAQKDSFLTTIIGDFNAKSCNWYSHDKKNFEGSTIESIKGSTDLDYIS